MAKTVSTPTEDEEGAVSEELKNESKNSKCCKLWNDLPKHVAIVSICALTLVIILLIVTIILLLKRDQTPVTINLLPENKNIYGSFSSQSPLEDDQKTTPTHENPKANLTLPDKLKLISRLEWMAEPPVEAANALATPVPYVIIMHTATENCSSQAQCVFHVRFIQQFHIESRNWWDIGYNFLVGGDGEAYEGRGWQGEGAHTYGYNAKSIGIAFIGTFHSFKPPHRQITACKQLIAKGVELGYIRKDYKLLATKQLQNTMSPGAALYEEMKTWEHWAKAP